MPDPVAPPAVDPVSSAVEVPVVAVAGAFAAP